MRQAGRSLPEYRRLRQRYGLFEICRRPELCAQVTLEPVRRLRVDGAVLFADIMLPVLGMGVELDLVDGVGPVIAEPIRSAEQVARLSVPEPAEAVPFVLETVRAVREELPPEVGVIAFCGGLFTLAAYLVEGKASREFTNTKLLMYREPRTWHELLEKLGATMAAYLRAQVEAGADALQVFDSWVGALSPGDYLAYVLPHTRRLFDSVAATRAPAIHFGTATASLLEVMRDAGGDLLGADWRLDILEAWQRFGFDRGIQGNLDPARAAASFDAAREGADRILDTVAGRPGHIFNLGHGVLPETDPETLARLVDHVHSRTSRVPAAGS